MHCKKCGKTAAPLMEVVTGEGFMVVTDPGSAPYHGMRTAGEPIDFKEKWCFVCIKKTLQETEVKK